MAAAESITFTVMWAELLKDPRTVVYHTLAPYVKIGFGDSTVTTTIGSAIEINSSSLTPIFNEKFTLTTTQRGVQFLSVGVYDRLVWGLSSIVGEGHLGEGQLPLLFPDEESGSPGSGGKGVSTTPRSKEGKGSEQWVPLTRKGEQVGQLLLRVEERKLKESYSAASSTTSTPTVNLEEIPEEIAGEIPEKKDSDDLARKLDFEDEALPRREILVELKQRPPLRCSNAKPRKVLWKDAAMIFFSILFADRALSSVNRRKSTYNVREGECLSTIAMKHGTTVKSLLAKNPDLPDESHVYHGFKINI